jgi:hypothetical protein
MSSNVVGGSVGDILHEQDTTEDGDLVLYRCSECGQIEMSIGALHGHAERHRGYTRLGIQIPFTETAVGRFDQLMELTEILRVEQTSQISIEEVEQL